jgi:hypothetical protein
MGKNISYWKKCFEQGKELGKQKKKTHKKRLREILMGDKENE